MSSTLHIVILTPGTGGWYCGACMRDNALAKSLHAAGHRVSMLPMYLPLTLDEEELDTTSAPSVFFGGINIWLQQNYSFFRHTPAWFDGMLDSPWMLRGAARFSHMTSAHDHGELTLAMLRLEESRLGKELEKLRIWLVREAPDVLVLSTALQAGMIRELKRHLRAKIICCFQGEDTFLDGLPEPWRGECWRELALRVREADALVSPSAFYADLMRERLGPGKLTIHVIPNGIDTDVYAPAELTPGPPVIGYLARMSRQKGLGIMVEAFVHLRTVLGHPDARLHLAGAATGENEPLIAELKQGLATDGLAGDVTWSPNITRAEKTAMLGGLTLFSVPAVYPEAFGLYLIEAMAAGVPVVQPSSASFPEIVGRTGAGMLVPPGDPVALAQAWHRLLGQPDELRRMGETSRRAAVEFYDVAVMRDGFVALARDILRVAD